MSELYGFTAEERTRFLELWGWYKTQAPRRPGPALTLEDLPAPDVHVALSPEGEVGTGSGQTGGIDALEEVDGEWFPGVSECEVWRITDKGTGTGSGSSGRRKSLTRIEGMTKNVYNLYTMAVPPDTWMLVARTKGGVWVVTSILFDTTEC